MEDDKQKKPTNPKDALGIKKIPMHCVPSAPLLEVGLAMMEGGRKYGTHNYRAIGVRMSVYYDAIWRHLAAWWEGEDIDPDSGLHHLIKVAACCFVVRDSMIMGNCEDDRPLKYTNGLGLKDLNDRAAALIEKYPECEQPFLENTTSAAGIPLCHHCNGEGWQGTVSAGRVCVYCNGTGEAPKPPVLTLEPCGICSGTGKVMAGEDINAFLEVPCPNCKGKGTQIKLDGRN